MPGRGRPAAREGYLIPDGTAWALTPTDTISLRQADEKSGPSTERSTMTIASYEGVSATSLGLPATAAIPEAKGHLPVQVFTTRPPISSRLKQHFATKVDSIVMLSLLSPGTTGLADGVRCHEILVMAVGLKSEDLPVDVLEHIASLRSSGIIFACIHPRKGKTVCTMGLRRALPTRPGHQQEYGMHLGQTQTISQTALQVTGSTMDDLWDSLGAQIILGTIDGNDLDQRIARRERISGLLDQESKLARDHGRAKSTQDRNTIYAKLHKVRTELEKLQTE